MKKIRGTKQCTYGTKGRTRQTIGSTVVRRVVKKFCRVLPKQLRPSFSHTV